MSRHVLRLSLSACKLVAMATIHTIGGEETLPAAVARRLRGLIAEIRISKTEFAVRTGWDRGYLYRRLSGETPLDMHDLDTIEHTVGMRADYLVGGHEPKMAPSPPDGDGGQESRLRYSKPGPIHYKGPEIPLFDGLIAA